MNIYIYQSERTYVAGTAFQHMVKGTGRCSLHQDLCMLLHFYKAGYHSHSHLKNRAAYYFQTLRIYLEPTI